MFSKRLQGSFKRLQN